MSKFFKPINLPFPLNSDEVLVDLIKFKKQGQHPYYTIIDNINQYLNSEIIEIFHSLKIRTKYVILFGTDTQGLPFNTTIHHDTEVNENTGEWHDVPCAINWELSSSVSTMSWYDTLNFPAIDSLWRDTTLGTFINGKYSLPAGTAYKSSTDRDPSDFILLESCQLIKGKPILVRTDVPHQVITPAVTNLTVPRLCLSIRFEIEDIKSWDHALEVFFKFI
jgi:hypothetical protein